MVASEKSSIKLVSGDTITGIISGIKDGEVRVITDYGAIRIPIEKLSAESKKTLRVVESSEPEQLTKRIAELEDLVSRLREENAQLRKQGTVTPSPENTDPSVGVVKDVAPKQPAAEAGPYWISSTGKRHNNRCRYFGTSKGRAGGSSEGVACKVCGG